MSSTNTPSRLKAIQLRSIRNNSVKKRRILLSVLIPKEENFLARSPYLSETQTPKCVNFPKSNLDIPFQISLTHVVPPLKSPEKDLQSLNQSNPSSLISKFNAIYARSLNNSFQQTPKTSDNVELNVKDNSKASKITRRNTISVGKEPGLTDPDCLFSALVPPLKPAVVFKHFLNFLSKYEQEEILDYNEIYYIGLNSEKVKAELNVDNFGFDDERNNYRVVIGDHLAYRYEVQQVLGKGSFSIVCKCFDHKLKRHVAVKIVRNQSKIQTQAQIELEILNHIRKSSDNDSLCISLLDHFTFRRHFCLVFELLSTSLFDLLKSNNFRGFSLSVVRRLVVQIISSLIFLRENKIIHCDLKPENILLREPNKSALKLIDFGSACFQNERLYTYIQSRFYRAPEIILGIEYTTAIDMWSLGCIAAELYTGYPLFAGESETDQLFCIMETLGLPPSDMIQKSKRKKIFFDGKSPKYMESQNNKKRIPGSWKLEERVRTDDKNFLDFIARCIEWDPSKRMSPEEGFLHEFIQEGLRNFHRSVNASSSSRANGT